MSAFVAVITAARTFCTRFGDEPRRSIIFSATNEIARASDFASATSCGPATQISNKANLPWRAAPDCARHEK